MSDSRDFNSEATNFDASHEMISKCCTYARMHGREDERVWGSLESSHIDISVGPNSILVTFQIIDNKALRNLSGN